MCLMLSHKLISNFLSEFVFTLPHKDDLIDERATRMIMCDKFFKILRYVLSEGVDNWTTGELNTVIWLFNFWNVFLIFVGVAWGGATDVNMNKIHSFNSVLK